MRNEKVYEWLKTLDYDVVIPEYTYGDSRIDFYMERGDQKYLMEVKGCTLEVNGIGYFPDAPTERGVKHIWELIKAKKAGCDPTEAIMVGDRLDNDIVPAKRLGMNTVWVRQAYAIYQSIDDESKRPDYIVDNIEELTGLFERITDCV